MAEQNPPPKEEYADFSNFPAAPENASPPPVPETEQLNTNSMLRILSFGLAKTKHQQNVFGIILAVIFFILMAGAAWYYFGPKGPDSEIPEGNRVIYPENAPPRLEQPIPAGQ